MFKRISGLLTLMLIILPAFAGEKPGATSGPLQRDLQAALAGADRVEVREIDGEGFSRSQPFTIDGKEKIAELVKILRFDESERCPPCACSGDHEMTFFQEGKSIVELSHHHARTLRWHDEAHPDDLLFAPGAQKAWSQWFDQNGYHSFEAQRLKALDLAAQEKQREDKLWAHLPAAARPIFEKLEKTGGEKQAMYRYTDLSKEANLTLSPLEKKFVKACGEPASAGLNICRTLGSMRFGKEPDDWAYVNTAETQLLRVAFGSLEAASMPGIYEKALQDDEGALGAARLFLEEKASGRIADEAMRTGLAARLARAGVTLGSPDDGARCLQALDGMWSPDAEKLLLEVAAGSLKSGKGAAREDEPGPQAMAILILASRGNKEAAQSFDAASSVFKTKQDQAALAIARAYAGDRAALRPEIFQVHSFITGYEALKCLERLGDHEALDLIVTAGTIHPYSLVRCEAVHVVQRMTGKVWFHGEPNENEDWYGKDIREWWQGAKDTWQPTAPGK